MIISTIFGLAALLIGSASSNLVPRDHDSYDYFAVHLHPSLTPEKASRLLGARHEGQIGELADHHTFSKPKGQGYELDLVLRDLRDVRRERRGLRALSQPDARDELGIEDGVLWSKKLVPRQWLQKRIPPPPAGWKDQVQRGPRDPKEDEKEPDEAAMARLDDVASTLSIEDPIFNQQWHLLNPYEPGNDLNVTGLWLEGITGNGSISAVVDDGLDMESNDLADNYFAEGSYDFNDNVDEPKPRLSDDHHGTRCAGEIAAVRNDVCGVGVAYDSKVAGIRILSKPVTDEDEAAAINYGFQQNQIYSCSWGPVDDGKHMDAPSVLIQRAMVNGIQKGRDGKGSIFVFAAGNGAASGDNCNFDGYTNSIYSITVGAIDRNNVHPYYSESCSAQLVVTYSSSRDSAIHTTDTGTDTCSSRHGGTSAAGPLVVGVAALALSVRPELTWRDMQHIMVQTAIPVNEDDEGWQDVSNGKKFSHDYGFGKVDAYAVVQLAKEWELVKPQAWFHSPWNLVQSEIPQGDKGLASSFEVTEDMLQENNLETLEHVTVTMNVNHTLRGDLSVELQSPTGVTSYLSTTRDEDTADIGYVDWTFMSVAHWGESGIGKWTVVVKDNVVNNSSGTFDDWRLNLWGESIDGGKQELHPLPDEHDHDHETQVASYISTTTVLPGSTNEPSPTNTDDYAHRPVNAEPGQTSATATMLPTPSSTSSGIPFPDNFLPSPFPTFGVSKATQIWIYGSIALIIVFCAALGIYFWVQRRKRIRNNPRDDYEFERVADDESGFPLSGVAVGGRPTQRRRGGELYDAFAGESDEEGFLSDAAERDSDEDSYHDDGLDYGGESSEKVPLKEQRGPG